MNQVNKEYLKLNKNILLSWILSAVISALVAQSLSEQETYLNSTVTIVTGYVVFFIIFGSRYYFDTRKKYGILRNNLALNNELKRLIASLSIGEIFYLAIRWSTLYHFLNVDYEPYIASIISEIISTGLYMLVVTISARLTGLYKEN